MLQRRVKEVCAKRICSRCQSSESIPRVHRIKMKFTNTGMMMTNVPLQRFLYYTFRYYTRKYVETPKTVVLNNSLTREQIFYTPRITSHCHDVDLRK